MATNVKARLEEQVIKIDTQIAKMERDVAAERSRLLAIRSQIEGVIRLITPDIEAAVATLERLGFINPSR